jgi:NAD(P)-dependent dehydrogenase (short-subunit alcohol dehydrogenase family)
MAAELGPFGITANVVCPGSTATDMLKASAAVYGLTSEEEFSQHHLLARLLQPEEIAAAIVFLCGPGSSGMTGGVIAVDAGMDAK